MAELAPSLEEIQSQIQSGDLRQALSALAKVQAEDSGNPEVYYMQAVCHRYRQEFDLALKALQTLKSINPDHGRAHQEEGHTYKAMGDTNRALVCYQRAVFYNPALAASLQSPLEILQTLGQTQRSAAVQAQLDYLRSLPKPLVAVLDLTSQGKLLKAEDICRNFMRQVPGHVEGMRLLAELGIRFGVLEDAEYLLESAAELEPQNVQVRIDYIQALRKRQHYEKALKQAQLLLQSQTDNPQFKSIFAIECMHTGNFEEAIGKFDEILEVLPDDPVTLTSKGHALKTQGDSNAAITSYHAAITSNRFYGEAYYSLANLKTYRFKDKEVAEMSSIVEDGNLSFMDRVYINFALGKAFEDREDYSTSFKHYQDGNRLKKSQSRYRAQQMTDQLNAQKQFFTIDYCKEAQDKGCGASDPIFVLGLPRAGSTLIEQILSSHSLIDGTMELPNILSLAQRLRRKSIAGRTVGYPDVLGLMEDEEFRRLGEEFIKDTRIHREGAPFFIDKMPNNFRHIGLIKQILPNAKIIDARRNPLDCCLSGFKQLFAEGQEFSYDLSDLGRYYRDYVELMDYWDEVFPGFVLRVNNEDVIADLEGQVRRMLNFCGLPFEDSCLEFHKTERNVRTPSSEQVRKPVSRRGVGQWRHFEDNLEPLKAALGNELVELSIGA